MLHDLKLTTKKIGSGPIWSWMIDQLGWVTRIDELVSVAAEDCRLSVGQRVKALMVNILTDRKALYKVQEFYSEFNKWRHCALLPKGSRNIAYRP